MECSAANRAVILILLSLISSVRCQHLKSSVAVHTALPTVTVRGFLNFKTTVDGTVIVFTPASSAVTESTASVVPKIVSTESPEIRFSTKSSAEEITPTKVPQHVIEPTRASAQLYPTGLVTVLGGTIVKNGETTVHETKVIGTYIDGKYAQILQSTARVHGPALQTPTIQPTQTYKPSGPSVFVESPIRKAYVMAKDEPLTEPKTPEFDDNNHLQSYRKPEPRRLHPRLALNPLRSRWAQNLRQSTDDKSEPESSSTNKSRTKARLGTRRFTLPPRSSPRVRMNRFKAKLPATQLEEQKTYNSKVQSRTEEQIPQSRDNKPENESEKQNEEPTTQMPTEEVVIEPKPQIHHMLPLEASPEIDPSKVVKEVQTITSEVTQHVEGNQVQVKTLTLTTTIQRTLHPSEFETDLIAPTIPVEGNDVDATSIQETPALVISRTYSVTERSMRTTVVPIFDGTSTASHTVTESFFIRKLITAYKTLPPGDVFLLETAGLALNDNMTGLNDLSVAEQSITPSLYDGAIAITDEPNNEISATSAQPLPIVPTLDPSMNLGFLANNQLPQFDINNPLFLAAALQNPQLAAVYLGLQQLQQQTTQYSTITRPTSYLTTDTVFNTKVVSFYDGRSTRSRTIVEPAGTSERMVTTMTTEVMPVVNNFNANPMLQQFQANAQLQNMFGSQLIAPKLQMTPQMNTITKTVTTVTDSTSTKTKVYTLVYNAFSTRYRTVTSTSVVPTTMTTVITSTIPIQTANTASPFNIFG